MKSKIIQHCVSSNVRKKSLSEPTTTLKIILEYGKTPSKKPRFKQLGLRNMIPTVTIGFLVIEFFHACASKIQYST